MQIVEPDGVTVRDTFPVEAPVRVTQQSILPTAIAQKFQAPVIFIGLYTSAPFSVPDGSSLALTTKTENLDQQSLIQTLSWNAYIDQIDPYTCIGESVSSSTYPLYSWGSLWDRSDTDIGPQFVGEKPWIAVNRVQVRNNSGSTQTMYIQATTKIIVNRTSYNNSASGF